MTIVDSGSSGGSPTQRQTTIRTVAETSPKIKTMTMTSFWMISMTVGRRTWVGPQIQQPIGIPTVAMTFQKTVMMIMTEFLIVSMLVRPEI